MAPVAVLLQDEGCRGYWEPRLMPEVRRHGCD
jgi:hypothetical protein